MSTDTVQLLINFKNKVEKFLQDYFNEKSFQARKIDVTAREAINMIRDYTMSGGKRIRPAFLYYGYLAAGGQDCDEVVKISMAIELLHSFFLIHDDIVDKDATRHGVATIHEKYKKNARKYDIEGDRNHFGNSMAIMSGDMVISMAHEVIFQADFSNDVILKIFSKIQEIIFMVISGQMIDITMSSQNKKVTKKQILRMHEKKTAHYTFEGPIQIGCILAGAGGAYADSFSEYAISLGKAFQIKDDIMGIFGNEKKIGKTVGSDIRENKKTLLILKALENGNKKQIKIIKKYLGRENISEKEIKEFRNIIINTGSLKYSENLAKSFADEAQKALAKIDFKDSNAKKFFTGIVDYVINREL